jgi:glycine hydroxymethyltransferase
MGASAYPRDFDYERFRKIADANGSILLMDMAHISGLVATKEAKNPFDFCDIVTTTTHKTLRGPRSGMIFYKKQYETKINMAVFPGLQGGPHIHQIAGLAVQLKEAQTPEFHDYIKQVKKNNQVLGDILVKNGYKLCTGGSDNHLQLWDLRPTGITGSKMEKICEFASITLNKNAVFGDKSALSPGGVRIGTPALTTRGFKEKDFVKVAEFLIEALKLAQEIQKKCKSKKLKDFIPLLKDNKHLLELKQKVESFAQSFFMPGI